MVYRGHSVSGSIKSSLNDERQRPQQVNTGLRVRVSEDEHTLARGREGLLRRLENEKKIEGQFRQARRMESINGLAASIAHDFNNFLTVIQGCTMLMKNELGDPNKLGEDIAVIESAVHEGASLVRQILSIGQKNRENFRLTSVNSWLTDMVQWLKNSFPKTITFTLDVDPSQPHILADVRQLKRLLLNLCLNAKDAMRDSGTIRLSTRIMAGMDLKGRFPEIKERTFVRISVADTGEGMDEKTRERIFEPFFTTKDPGKGTGLGLPICHRIIKSHGGLVDVESKPGRGSTFRVYFPLTQI